MNCTKRIFVTTTLLIFLLTGWLPWEKPASAMPRIQKKHPSQPSHPPGRRRSFPPLCHRPPCPERRILEKKTPRVKEALAYLTAKGLLLGTSRNNVLSLNEQLDFMGISLSAGANRDYATLNLRVLRKDLDRGLDLFFDCLMTPAFPESEVQREIEKTLAAIQSAEDQPETVAEKEFEKTLFLTSPYSHPSKERKTPLNA